MLLLGLTGCSADELTDHSSSSGESTENVENRNYSYIAFNLIIEEDERTRAPYDADYDDDVGGYTYNKGLAWERALYFEAPRDPDEEEEEYRVPCHFAVLFNQDGSRRGEIVPLDLSFKEDLENDPVTVYGKFYDPESADNPFENEFTGTVWVVLNASPDIYTDVVTAITKATPLTELRKLVLQPSPNNSDPDNFLYLKDEKGKYITDDYGNRYLTMSSSIIVDGDNTQPAVTTTSGKNVFHFYETEEDARNNPTSLFIERLTAKYTVLFKGEDGLKYYLISEYLMGASEEGEEEETPGTGNEFNPVKNLILYPSKHKNGEIRADGEITPLKYVVNYKRSPSIGNRNEVDVQTTTDWKVNILGWEINGIDYEEYLFKTIESVNYFENWNIEPYSSYRNFWAEGVHYNNVAYPDQYRKVAGSGLKDFEETMRNSSTLRYFDFESLSHKNVRKYIPEHTYNVSVLQGKDYTSRAYMRAGSHLIMTAQLLINGMESRNLYERGYHNDKGYITYNSNFVNDKYLMNDIYWLKDAYMNYVIEYLGYWMLTDENIKLLGNNDGNFYIDDKGVKLKADASSFTIEKAALLGGDALVWVKPVVPLYIFNPDKPQQEGYDADGYKELTLEQYTTLMFDHQNYMALCLNEGRMYYASGSFHNLTTNYTTPKVGDYGTVRNNWYYFTVEGITVPGTPVSTPEQEIIPNVEPVVNGMGVSMKLLDWHYEFVNVDISHQRPK